MSSASPPRARPLLRLALAGWVPGARSGCQPSLTRARSGVSRSAPTARREPARRAWRDHLWLHRGGHVLRGRGRSRSSGELAQQGQHIRLRKPGCEHLPSLGDRLAGHCCKQRLMIGIRQTPPQQGRDRERHTAACEQLEEPRKEPTQIGEPQIRHMARSPAPGRDRTRVSATNRIGKAPRCAAGAQSVRAALCSASIQNSRTANSARSHRFRSHAAALSLGLCSWCLERLVGLAAAGLQRVE